MTHYRTHMWWGNNEEGTVGEALHNSDRAHNALTQINGYMTPDSRLSPLRQVHELSIEESDLVEQWATDLICDMHHLADAMGISWDTWIDRANTHYQEERDEEEQERLAAVTPEAIAFALRNRVIDQGITGLDVEVWNTGGGCMVTYVILSRHGGSPVTRNGEPTGQKQATEFLGITHEDEWVLCYVNDLIDEGVEHEVAHVLKAGDVDAMAKHVVTLAVMHRAYSLTCRIIYREKEAKR